MPKVTKEYTDAKRAHILRAAEKCFLRSGFHATSMQDLFDESGLSSGAVYRYFPSKDALILWLATENLREVSEVVRATSRAGTAQPVGKVLTEILSFMSEKHQTSGFASILVQIWSEALLNAQVGEALRVLQLELRTEFTAFIREHQAAHGRAFDTPPETLAGALLGSMQGYILQLAVLGPHAVEGMADALARHWTQTLSTGRLPVAAADRSPNNAV